MNNGWIKLHRKLLDNPVYRRPAYLSVWLTLLLLANHEDKKFMWNNGTIVIHEGSLVTGRDKLSKLTGVSSSTIERVLQFLENEHQIEQQKTTKYRVITIINWKEYQTSDNKTDNKRTTNGQQTDTYKNVRRKEGKNTEQKAPEPGAEDIPVIIDSFKEVNPSYSKFFGNTTQRSAVQRLLGLHGKDQLIKVISMLPKTNSMRFFPSITSPVQLEDKWAALKTAYERKKDELSAKDWRNNVIA